jgi:hypothetical protein
VDLVEQERSEHQQELQVRVGQAPEDAVEVGEIQPQHQQVGHRRLQPAMPRRHNHRDRKGEARCKFKQTNGRWPTKKVPLSWLNLDEVTEEPCLFNLRRCLDEPILQAEKVVIRLAAALDLGLSILLKFYRSWLWRLSTTIVLFA